MLTPGVYLGMNALNAGVCMDDSIDDLLEKQNGINVVFLFHNADLRTMLFSA